MSLLTELRAGDASPAENDDNLPLLMYKGKAEQISNPLIAYARLTHIRTRIRFCLRLR